MSGTFVSCLAAAVVAVLASRLLVSGLPLPGAATRLTVVDATFLGVGITGLAFHCGAMFFRSQVDRLPGLHSTIATINALGSASILWYVMPALLVVVGLRRQHPLALIVVAAALATVGYTMYDDGSLTTHLRSIFVAVVLLAGVATTLVVPPWEPNSTVARP